jgi:membrane-bound lytic murein transglycosylase D
MKRLVFLLVLLWAGWASAQDNTLTLDDDLFRSAEQWAKENLDEDALRVLQQVDQDKVRQLLAAIQRQFQGEYVIDLAQLKDAARAVLPLLESYQETLPYALWLKTRLDYLDVADQFRMLIPPPRREPGQPLKPAPNPTPQKEREVWVHKLSERPVPKNAKPYVSFLKPIFAAAQVPAELVWVAEVESSFDPRARSPVGAAGLFQLMPDTAHRYGLRTWPLDQRLKPENSGRAAAQYLCYLHRRFKDWRLALAAYNAGEGTVQNLLTRRKAASFDAISTHLPAETQLFVPKVEATVLRREGLQLAQLRVPGPGHD